jgi:hypothetical protein
MRSERGKTTLRCAIYTRVSTEHGLELRGFEPLTSAVSHPPLPLFSLYGFMRRSDEEKWRESHFAVIATQMVIAQGKAKELNRP